jgi:hypothetical protein
VLNLSPVNIHGSVPTEDTIKPAWISTEQIRGFTVTMNGKRCRAEASFRSDGDFSN